MNKIIENLTKEESDKITMKKDGNFYQFFNRDKTSPFLVIDDETKQVNFLNSNTYEKDGEIISKVYEQMLKYSKTRTF